MTVLYVPFSLVVLDIIAIFAVIGVGYYATKMFYHMRRGRLESGWLPMIFGAILVAAGYVFLTLEDFFLAYSFFYQTLDYLGTGICSVGLIVIMLGLRSHYKAWSLKKPSPDGIVGDVERKAPIDDVDLR